MKVIDLLNKMANGEDVPEKIKYYGCIYELKDRNYEYYNYKDNEGTYLEDEWFLTNILNDELEIIEDTPKEDIPTSKLYKNNKLQYDLTPKEDEKIKKLNEYVDIGSFTNQIGIEDNLGFVHWSNDLKEGLDKQTNFNKNVLYKINEIIDKINGDSNE